MSVKPIRALEAIREFLKLESASGIILVGAAVLALIISNSPLSSLYDLFLDTPVEIRIGALHLAKPLLLWINDGLMAIFFLLIGLEVKREILDGQLSSISQVALPGIAAIGGMAIPALIYIIFNISNASALNGWAIPAATDIAFALGILALLGSRVPLSLKLFLLTLAIIDDLGAIVIIAIFYSGDLSVTSLIFAGVAIAALFAMNLLGVKRIAAYVVVGIILWICVLKSGVHATLAGVILAFAIPLRTKEDEPCPLREMEHSLHPWIAFGIMPIFAFANAGVSLEGMSFGSLFEPIPIGIALGLFLGKQAGVFGFSLAAVKLGLAKLPSDINWRMIYGTSVLCGIGFTMSLFISTLAFDSSITDDAASARIGILVGSFISAIAGYLILSFYIKNDPD
ncbi:MAG: Na+/H+ antiporter NhaA [Candidatus Dadabacteria bacterium]|nr:Na+/H+ antiporter NhaA [Candidatus Dadabacteria bacterium]MCZ6528199.1 Na+/H+ antiporter NhaA [Candidatus Dadabacteria bacterium]MCZ6554974.1 Na+/H+ antiporter NhaA [Candidatus Dadabacteria bacterium]